MDSSNEESNNGEDAFSNDVLKDSGCEAAVTRKTNVSLFQEICTKFDFGMPLYNFINESGEAHHKSFCISLTVWTLGISVVGKANTKMQAKHNAAYQMMNQLKKTAQTGGTLNGVEEKTLMKCLEWMNTLELKTEGALQQPTETQNPSGILTSFALTRHLNLPEYTVVSSTGPSHCKKFVMTCKMNEHVTQGEGTNKKICKNVAAEQMLLIVRGQFPAIE